MDVAAVVVGADIGGSTTRVGVADLSGQVLAEARGGPGNPVAVGREQSIAVIRSTIDRALDRAAARLDRPTPPPVARATVGLAGVTSLLRVADDAARFCAAVLPGTSVRLVSDFAVAFASGTWHDHGLVTIAGTGSGAMEIERGRDVSRRDGWGWLLGDEGSGFWLGREAVRTTLTQLEDNAPGVLAERVMEALGAGTVTEVLAACYRRPPRELAALAPTVVAAGDDPAAVELLGRAARCIGDRLLRLRAGRTDLPVVLAGSLVTGAGPLVTAVRKGLEDAGVRHVEQAGDGLAGALWLALRTSEDAAAATASDDRIGDTAEPARQWSALLGSLEACRRNNFDPC